MPGGSRQDAGLPAGLPRQEPPPGRAPGSGRTRSRRPGPVTVRVLWPGRHPGSPVAGRACTAVFRDCPPRRRGCKAATAFRNAASFSPASLGITASLDTGRRQSADQPGSSLSAGSRNASRPASRLGARPGALAGYPSPRSAFIPAEPGSRRRRLPHQAAGIAFADGLPRRACRPRGCPPGWVREGP